MNSQYSEDSFSKLEDKLDRMNSKLEHIEKSMFKFNIFWWTLIVIGFIGWRDKIWEIIKDFFISVGVIIFDLFNLLINLLVGEKNLQKAQEIGFNKYVFGVGFLVIAFIVSLFVYTGIKKK